MKPGRILQMGFCVLMSSFCISENQRGGTGAVQASTGASSPPPMGSAAVISKVRLREQNTVNNSGIGFGVSGTAYVGTWGKATLSGSGPSGAGDASGSYSEGKVFAITRDGDLKWEYDPGFAADFDQNILRHFGTIESAPTVDPDDPSIIYFGRGDGRLFCVQDQGRQGPKKMWEYDTTQDCAWGKYLGKAVRGGQIFCSPAVGRDGAVYFGITKNPGTATALYAVDKATGKLRWRYPQRGSLPTSKMVLDPALHQDRVYFAVGPYLYAFATHQKKGAAKPVWSYRLRSSETGGGGDFYFGNPAVRNSTLYVAAMDQMNPWTQNTARLYAFDTKTGHARWDTPFLSGEAILHGPSLDAGDRVYLGGGDWYKTHSGPLSGSLTALLDRGSSWELLWSVSFDSPVSAPALGPDGRSFFCLKGDPRRSSYGTASVFSYTKDGNLIWGPVDLDAPTAATPITIDPEGRLNVADAPCQDLTSDCLNSDVTTYILQ